MCLKSILVKMFESQWEIQFAEEAAGYVVLSGDCSSLMMSKVVGDWLIEHGLTSAPKQYRLYAGQRFLQVLRPNQQCQSTEGGWLVIQTGLSLTMLTSPCYNNTTCMQIL